MRTRIKKSLRGALDKFVLRGENSHHNVNINETFHNDISENVNLVDDENVSEFLNNNVNEDDEANPCNVMQDDENTILPLGSFDNIDNKLRDTIVKKGPIRESNLDFPLDVNNMHFSYSYFARKLSNGEISDRKWLVYSKSVDKVFSFCCKLFKFANNRNLLANEGLRDWQHISERLKKHETSAEHMTNKNTWNELRERLKKSQTIDKTLQEIMKRKMRMRHVFFRIFCAIKCLFIDNM